MKQLSILLICALAFILSSCNSIELSEKIKIKTSKDINVEAIKEYVWKVNQQQMREKIYTKFPDAIRQYVDRIEIAFVTETVSSKKSFNNVEFSNEKYDLYVQISLDYEKTKKDQASQIISYAKTLMADELTKLDVNIIKEL
jgi:hypothetical protein